MRLEIPSVQGVKDRRNQSGCGNPMFVMLRQDPAQRDSRRKLRWTKRFPFVPKGNVDSFALKKNEVVGVEAYAGEDWDLARQAF